MSKGDFHVVNFSGNVQMNTGENIFPSDKVRSLNTNAPVSRDTFHKFEIEVPEDIRE